MPDGQESSSGRDGGSDSMWSGILGSDDCGAFGDLAGQVAGEPLLGPTQFELVSGINRRLEHGPPLSQEDRATYLDQLRILRIIGPVKSLEHHDEVADE